MTVAAMLQSMSQKELCHWIAFFKIEQERFDKEKDADTQGSDKQVENESSGNRKPEKSEYTQAQKDGALLSQLFALASCKDL